MASRFAVMSMEAIPTSYSKTSRQGLERRNSMQKVGRNDPCPCGSGKKHKKCCLRESEPPPRDREDSMRAAFVDRALAYFKRHYRDKLAEAHDFFWDDFDPKQHFGADEVEVAEISFWDWLIYDWQSEEDGKTLIHLYLENTKKLSNEETAVLQKMRDAVLSLFEVLEVYPEKGFRLKDLLLGGEYDVKEKMATRSLRKWDIFGARLLHFDGQYGLSGSVYPYPVSEKDPILKHLKECFRDHKKDHPDTTMRDFLKQNGVVLNYCWCEIVRKPFRPTLVTMSGEPMVISTAIFEIRNEEGVLRGLRTIDEVEEIEEGVFEWLDTPRSDESASILGTIRLKDNTLKLECASKERLERGKKLILDNLGGSVVHKGDIFQDPYQAMKDLPKTPPKPETEIPPEVKRDIYLRYMQDHYERWLNEKIPALNGCTPLEAVKQPSGKKRVIEILKSIENTEEHRRLSGEPYFDSSWLWERLGIER
jgi:hypothetical protein